tara:strand:- start:307 stop:588 length:282 start_codon:yes stop_codon:yes gene_type:complete
MDTQYNEVVVARLMALLRHAAVNLPMLKASHPNHRSDDDLFECASKHVKGWRDDHDLPFPVTATELRVACDAYACSEWELWEIEEDERRYKRD